MIMNFLKIFSFLFFINSFSQNIETIEVERDQRILSFINDFKISPNDFFILNPSYTNTRFNHSELDLNKNIIKGDLVRVFSISKNNDLEEISFISHKIKRKQNLSEISSIYGVSKTLILKYNSGVDISRNNILKIPGVVKSNSPTQDRLKPYIVQPKEGKWRIAYKYGISIEILDNLNQETGTILKIGQKIAVPNKAELELKIVEENRDYFEIQNNIQISVLEQKLGLNKNSIVKLNPGIIDKIEKGIIIKVPFLTKTNEDVINLSKKSLKENIINFETKKFALILPFRLDNFNYDSIQKSTPILKNDKLLNISLDFLFGVEMAVNSYSQLGIDVQMDVYDSALNMQKIDKILSENDFENYDFVLGPLSNNLFDYFVNSTVDLDIKIIKPLSKKQNTDSRIVNTIPNDSILFNKIISHVKKDSIKSEKYIISDLRSIDISDKIKQIFPNAKQFYSKVNESGVDTKTLVYDDLDSTFVKGKNIVFLETKEQGFVSNVTSILNSFINDTINIELVTTNKNNAFEGVNISNNFLSNLKFQYPSINKKIDIEKDSTFIEEFISNYNFSPNKYSLRAYDLVYDMLLRISNGDFDDNDLHEIETEYFENKFKYKRSFSGSIDNVSVYLMKFENLKVDQLSDN
ncbi:MAG: hypothetical protein CMC36_03755 [Flavobacteriaceae bacterium]|nr:hypothetical protein [Flavobacteriaceae bacterium]